VQIKTLFLRRGCASISLTASYLPGNIPVGFSTLSRLGRLLGFIGPVPPPLFIRKIFNYLLNSIPLKSICQLVCEAIAGMRMLKVDPFPIEMTTSMSNPQTVFKMELKGLENLPVQRKDSINMSFELVTSHMNFVTYMNLFENTNRHNILSIVEKSDTFLITAILFTCYNTLHTNILRSYP
jgi:hypothetical protein